MARVRRTWRGRSARGVTLTELLVVIAIIGLTLLIAVPNFTGGTEQAGLRAAARNISTSLHAARRQAIAERTPFCVVLDADSSPNRVWVARWDLVDDGVDDDAGVFTRLDQVGNQENLPDNVLIVAVLVGSTDFPGDGSSDFDLGQQGGGRRARFNVTRTEDVNMDNVAQDAYYDDTGEDGIDGTPSGLVDVGEDNTLASAGGSGSFATAGEEATTVYRVIRFGPQGNADRALIYLWNTEDGGAPLPQAFVSTKPDMPASLVTLGLPPGLSLFTNRDNSGNIAGDTGPTQRDYFTVSDQSMDSHYFTVEVSPVTGAVQIWDYARGQGLDESANDTDGLDQDNDGTPDDADERGIIDWNLQRDATS